MNTLDIRFQRARIGPVDQAIFRDFDWLVEPHETWVITGPNGSGKSALAVALAGGLAVGTESPTVANVLPDPSTVAVISFERQRDLIFAERYHDDSDFVEGGVDPGTSALDFMLGRKRGASAAEESPRLSELVGQLGISSVLDRGLKYLSTGEIRKVLLCKELLREPAWLIFDEPYEGLDSATREVLKGQLEQLVQASREPAAAGARAPTRVLLITDRYEHIPAATSHVLCLEDRRVRFAGPRTEFEASDLKQALRVGEITASASLTRALDRTLLASRTSNPSDAPGDALVELRNVRVTYGERRVLDGLNFTIRSGQHTLVRGPNGCGKTTLLNLINGDNPQVYANDVRICGMKRGSGESVWDVKKQLGQVSYALHVEYAYHCSSNLIETLLSGFYDSIGLYQEPDFEQIKSAERWLAVVGLLGKRARPFIQLSYGEQRIALILRAIIKQPPLLILDEPCHGLDARHRQEVLTIADHIGTHTASTILYVTHDPAEQLACTAQRFEFSIGNGWTLTESARTELNVE